MIEKPNYNEVFLLVIKANKDTFPDGEHKNLRASLLKDEVIKLMGKAKSIEEARIIKAAYETVVWNNPI
jgi:hypothetical protein